MQIGESIPFQPRRYLLLEKAGFVAACEIYSARSWRNLFFLIGFTAPHATCRPVEQIEFIENKAAVIQHTSVITR